MSEKKHFLAELEEQMLAIWEKEKTFEKSLKNRDGAELFNFYDGPPFANGMPHYGHFVQTTIKDTITRYKTMRGYYVPRRVGWDTHGLPVEYAIEKEHDFKGKQDIIKYGIDKFNQECRESVFKYKNEWEKMFKRVGRWADFDSTYATLDNNYIESVWWVFKTLFDKGLVYKDFRSLPYCPRCATPLSNFELNQGYKDGVKDPSLYVKFKIKNENAFLLGWTTTPWSLPGNSAIAVKSEARYAYVEVKNDKNEKEVLVLAVNRLDSLNQDDYHIVKEVSGKELVGKEYEPLFQVNSSEQLDNCNNAYKVWPAEFVSIEDGTGVLHVAPAFGEDDLNLSKKYNLPVFLTVDDDGKMSSNFSAPEQIVGRFFKQADKHIIEYLTTLDRIYAAEMFEHTYPFCWRCDTPLMYYATDSWQVKVSELSDRLVKNNKIINWTPNHIRDGRFGNWLQGARDWAISRNRFWGAPIPVWRTEDGELVVVGSLEELKNKSKNPGLINDIHRPYIDDVEIVTESGKVARRIPEVFDCWFESGSMPYAQDHYPFEDKENWEKTYPADFIAEAIDQTRGWFYTLHVLATALFDKPAFNNVICTGWVVAADGEKLSKRKKNYAPMDEVFDAYGVDTLRFFMSSSPIVNGEDVRFSVDYLRDVQRKVFMTLNNVFNFYKLYADVDRWKPENPGVEPSSDNLLDQWMISRLSQAIEEITTALDSYRLDRATRPLMDILDDTSNWYVRRSRRRFWKSEDDDDKQQAYETLNFVLMKLCQLLAPFSPFLSDYIWRQLFTEADNIPKSVHLSDWPTPGDINRSLLNNMSKAREYVTLGLSERAANKIKVRQPLSYITVPKLPKIFKDIIADELNVKAVKWGDSVKLNCEVTPELKFEGLMRDIVRVVQSARKEAGLNVDDRITLALITDDKDLSTAIKLHLNLILAETLTSKFVSNINSSSYTSTEKVEGKEIKIQIKKTGI